MKSRRNKVDSKLSRLMGQQLRFYAENTRRLLQGCNYMFHHLKLDRAGIGAAWRDEEIAHHPFAAFIHEKGVTDDASPLDGGIPRQDLGIDVTRSEEHTSELQRI